jgi:hypothetical protein
VEGSAGGSDSSYRLKARRVHRKVRAVLLSLPAAAVLAAAVWGGLWYRSRNITPTEELKRLPLNDAVVVYVDFAALRSAGVLGLLENSKVAEEAEYEEFERRTDFDYKRDLDSALLAVAPTGRYLLVRGRFDWKKLQSYVEAQNGRCVGALCRLQGSAPERRISFFPVRSDLMALAVSADDSAVLRMSTPAGGATIEAPAAPLWVSVPSSALQSGESLPSEARTFAQTLARANSVVLYFVAEPKRYAVGMQIECRTREDAADLARQLNQLTASMRQTFTAEHQKPNAADLTGVLAGGSFLEAGKRVLGYWPIERAFLENLLGGGATR